jgi:hypothetical protein
MVYIQVDQHADNKLIKEKIMKRIKLFLVLLAVGLLLAACTMPRNDDSEEEAPGQAQTMAAKTVEARLTQNAGGSNQQPLAPTNTVSVVASNTPLPTNTPQLNNTPFPTTPPTSSAPCNRASFVEDVTIPDGTAMSPGESFTKTWRLKNTGSCTWTSEYKLVFDSGDAMGAAAVVNLPGNNVPPNDTEDVSIAFTAPTAAGNYTSNWKLRSNTGEVFGLGSDAQGSFFVEINVVAPLNYSLSVANSHVCGADVVVALAVYNLGSEFLQSAAGNVTDLDSSVTKSLALMNDPFVEDPNSCASGYVSDADPGETYYFLVNVGAASTDDRFQITTSFCTQDGLGGDCLDKSINYKIP